MNFKCWKRADQSLVILTHILRSGEVKGCCKVHISCYLFNSLSDYGQTFKCVSFGGGGGGGGGG